MKKYHKTIVLFDVDGTLTAPRQPWSLETKNMILKLRDLCDIGFVGGSDLEKQKEQLGQNVLELFDYCFSENGLVSYFQGTQLKGDSFIEFMKEYNKFVEFILSYIAEVEIPVKTGTFIELRKGMVNVSPIGRNCTLDQRNEFEKYDSVHHVREKMIEALKSKFGHLNLTYSIGGQISFDVFPLGWDKTYCLKYLKYEKIHFFGDKVTRGGNDYEIYNHSLVTGHQVTNPQDTKNILKTIFPEL